MKKIIALAVTALALVALVVGLTMAYFSDAETNTGNVFSAGTIDLQIDSENPWTSSLNGTLTDMMPGMTATTTTVVENQGQNPADVWMRIYDVTTADGVSTEPELAEAAATDIDSVILYTLSGMTTADITSGYTISTGSHGVTGTAVEDSYIYLGTLASGSSWTLTQTFTLDTTVTNWAQGDTMTFSVEFVAQQTLAEAGPAAAPGTELDLAHTR